MRERDDGDGDAVDPAPHGEWDVRRASKRDAVEQGFVVVRCKVKKTRRQSVELPIRIKVKVNSPET